MSFSHRRGRATVRLHLEELETRVVPSATPTFAEAGTVFNDATRVLEGGLWQVAVQESNQPTGTVNRYVNDLTTVQTDLKAEKAAGQFTGATLTHVNTILGDLTKAINAAPASVANAGSPASVAAAETTLHNAHTDILNIVQHDDTLSALATEGGAVGFQQVPQKLPAGVTAANAPHENLAQIGAIFNDASNRILGGLGSASNTAAIKADLKAVQADLKDLRADHPDLFGGLTGIHADTIVRQISLELTFIDQFGVNPVSSKGSNDIFLDIIDIVQGDTNLANMANQDDIAGFGVFPDFTTPPTPYQDNQVQTQGLATWIAQSNALGQQAVNLITNHPEDKAAINALIEQLKDFGRKTTNFDLAQGGIFEARFDNELRGATSTDGAEIAAMIRGLRTENLALVTAAAAEMHANAADVAGNNIPVTGGHYNTDGTTVAEVLSTAHP